MVVLKKNQERRNLQVVFTMFEEKLPLRVANSHTLMF